MAATEVLQVRLNEDDKRAVSELAASSGRTMSGFIKMMIQREIGKREALTQTT